MEYEFDHQSLALLPSRYSAFLSLFYAEKEILAVGPRRQRSGAVAVLPLHGFMTQRRNLLGGTSTESFGNMLKAVVGNRSVSGIVLDIDSPGGLAVGVEELWQVIMGARGEKPIIAVANSMAASAAYWVASAADEIVVTPGGQIGSIGVFAAHSDFSVMLDKAGEKVTLINAGKKKVDGNPIEPLSARARTDIQKRVDILYASFVDGVAKGRGVSPSAVRTGFAEGGMVGAVEGVKLGMANRVGTLDQTVARLGSRRTNWLARGGRRAGVVRGQSDDTDLRDRRLALQELSQD